MTTPTTDSPTTTTGRPEVRARERCAWSDLLTDECAHCQGSTSPVTSIGMVERLVGRRAPEYRLRPREWRVPEPEPTACEHRGEDLCPACATLLEALIADVPELVAQLVTALRKGSRFAPHGFRRGDVQHPEESPLPWSPAAASVLGELNALLAGPPADRRLLLPALSRLAQRAHRVIDRPRDRAFTMCPRCRVELPVPDDDPQERSIICPTEGCSYAATWQQHQADLLDACGDALLTAEEIRFVLTHNGEPITRFRIQYLVTRHGLPREEIAIPQWQKRRIVTEAQYAYRLRDVRDLEAKLAG